MDEFIKTINRGKEHWNTLALKTQIETLDAMIAADLESDGRNSGYPVVGREDHPLEPVLDYLRETLERCGGGSK
jgi:hypothetical protein